MRTLGAVLCALLVAGASSSCAGSHPLCASVANDEAACGRYAQQYGCSWSGGASPGGGGASCAGSHQACAFAASDEAACGRYAQQYGCSWSVGSVRLTCEGSHVSCPSAQSESTCRQFPTAWECAWGGVLLSGCVGENFCTGAPRDACLLQESNGCVWRDHGCLGASAVCAKTTDEASCNGKAPGCVWAQASKCVGLRSECAASTDSTECYGHPSQYGCTWTPLPCGGSDKFYRREIIDDCTRCPAGFYTTGKGSMKGYTGCKRCPAGSACPDGGARQPCPCGQFSGEGAMSCTRACADGEYGQTTNGTAACIPCPPGSRCADGAKTACRAGSRTRASRQSASCA
jgi:hypothetical protein